MTEFMKVAALRGKSLLVFVRLACIYVNKNMEKTGDIYNPELSVIDKLYAMLLKHPEIWLSKFYIDQLMCEEIMNN